MVMESVPPPLPLQPASPLNPAAAVSRY